MAQFIVHGLSNTHCIRSTSSVGENAIDWLKSEIELLDGVPSILQRLQLSAWHSEPEDRIQTYSVVVKLGLDGGKGGFGTLLRGGNANKHGPVNNDSSRDLDGRRLRDANALSKIKKALDKKQAALDGSPMPESDEEEDQGKRSRNRLRRKKHKATEKQPEEEALKAEEERYLSKQRKEAEVRRTHKLVVEETAEAVETGFQAVSGQKLASSSNGTPSSKVNLFGDIYGSVLSSEDESESSESESYEDSDSDDKTSVPMVPVIPKHATTSTQSSAPTETPKVREIPTDEAERPKDGIKRSHDHMAAESQLDLMKYDNSVALEALGLDRLKQELASRGLMIGGTLTQRAVRLFQVRGLAPENYPPELLANTKKQKL